jgi:hypothetical protein
MARSSVGEDVAKVGKKIFVFFGRPGPTVGIGVKLARSLLYARTRPFVQRIGYGMDDAGWVAARFSPTDEAPLDLLEEWIEENFTAIAPKRLSTRDADESAAARRSAPARTRVKRPGRAPRKGT